MIQLTRSGTVLPDSGELMRLRDEFQRECWVRLPQLIEPALLEVLCSGLEQADFRPRVDKGIGAELCLEFCRTVASFSFLANNHQFFEIVKTIAGCDRIGYFLGRVYRLMEGNGCYDSWHNDIVGTRMVGMSINLSPRPYSGGLLLLRQRKPERVVAEIANTGFGDGVIFRLESNLEHRITDVEGSVSRTVFAGWFQSQPDFLSCLKEGQIDLHAKLT